MPRRITPLPYSKPFPGSHGSIIKTQVFTRRSRLRELTPSCLPASPRPLSPTLAMSIDQRVSVASVPLHMLFLLPGNVSAPLPSCLLRCLLPPSRLSAGVALAPLLSSEPLKSPRYLCPSLDTGLCLTASGLILLLDCERPESGICAAHPRWPRGRAGRPK